VVKVPKSDESKAIKSKKNRKERRKEQRKEKRKAFKQQRKQEKMKLHASEDVKMKEE
jgi:hypothetical protein